MDRGDRKGCQIVWYHYQYPLNYFVQLILTVLIIKHASHKQKELKKVKSITARKQAAEFQPHSLGRWRRDSE